MMPDNHSNAGNNRVLLQHHDARVCESDLRLLDDPTAWLNDACVHFGLVRLQICHRHRKRRRLSACQQARSKDRCLCLCEDNANANAVAVAPVPSSLGLPSSTSPSPSPSSSPPPLPPTAFFVDPAVVSFLTHQCEDEEEMIDLYRGLHADDNNGDGNDSENIEDDADEYDTYSYSVAASDSPRTRRGQRCTFYFLPINDNNAASREVFRRPGGGSHWSLLLVVAVATAVAPVAPPTCTDNERRNRNGGEENLPCSRSSGEDFSPVTVSSLICLHFDSSRGSNALAARTVATKFREVLLLGGGTGTSGWSRHTASPQSASASASASISASVVECRSPQQLNGHDCGLCALAAAEALSSDLPSLQRVLHPSISVVPGGATGGFFDRSSDVGEDEGHVREALVERCEGAVNAALSGGDFAPALRRRMAEEVRHLALASAAGGH